MRLVCRDGTGKGLPDAKFLQRASLGRRDFSPELATCAAGEPADSVCVVRVPYGTDRGGADSHHHHHLRDQEEEEEEEDGACRRGDDEADDEGVRHIARLRCRFCGHPFTPAGKALAVRAMPSGRWDECIEDMICFDGPQAVPVLARDVNFARAGRCLMAQVEVLLHPGDVVRGAVKTSANGGVSPPAAAAAAAGAVSDTGPEEGRGWRGLECARCDLPLGRLATVEDGHDRSTGNDNVAEEDRGLLLLKHCVLGDDVSAAVGQDGGAPLAAKGDENDGPSCPPSPPPLPPHPAPSSSPRVFENRTAIKWVMGEMAHYNERDGCARFIVSARGRSPAAPGGSLTLVLTKTDGLVSVSGGDRPARAHRVKFREESRREAERRDEEERGAGGGKEPAATAAKVPARVLEVSYGEYRAVRDRIVGAAWAGASCVALDPRGYTQSYLF